jgi:hypothetical protein
MQAPTAQALVAQAAGDFLTDFAMVDSPVGSRKKVNLQAMPRPKDVASPDFRCSAANMYIQDYPASAISVLKGTKLVTFCVHLGAENAILLGLSSCLYRYARKQD